MQHYEPVSLMITWCVVDRMWPRVSTFAFIVFLSLISKMEFIQCNGVLSLWRGFVMEFKLDYFQLMHGRIIDLSPGRNYGILLLLVGDVAMNPGPFCFPCSVCTLPVHSNQCGIKWDNCSQWCHAACGDADNYQYQEMIESENFSWCCPTCLLSQLPFLMWIPQWTQLILCWPLNQVQFVFLLFWMYVIIAKNCPS